MKMTSTFRILVALALIASPKAFAADESATIPAGQLNKGLEAFQKNVYPLLRNQCIECHSRGPGPSHSSDNVFEAYQITKGFVPSFQNLHYSKLVTKGTNGHGNAYGAKKKVTLTEDELVLALQKWWDEGENTAFFDGKLVLPSQNIPSIPQNGFATMTWDLKDLRIGNTGSSSNANLEQIKFQVDVERFMDAESNHGGAYRLKNPRLLTNGQNVKIIGLYITMNGQFDGLATDYSTIRGVVRSEQKEPGILSSNMQIVLDGQGLGKDQLGFAFGKIELSTAKPTILVGRAEQGQPQAAAPAKPINPAKALKVFDPSVVGDKAWRFVKIPKSEFEMGSLESDPNHFYYQTQTRERLHKVCLSSFEIQATDVTQLQWQLVMGTTPSRFKDSSNCDSGNFAKTDKGEAMCKHHPVEQVAWEDNQNPGSSVKEFIKRLNQIQSDYTYSLPTESQWEYISRNGLPVEYSYGWGSDFDATYAWFSGNSNNRTHEVGTREPLYVGQNQEPIWDLNGNVWQWMSDYFDENYGLSEAQLNGDKCIQDPKGPATGSDRVFRGGSWYGSPRYLRSAYRNGAGPGFRYVYVGFRLVRTPR